MKLLQLSTFALGAALLATSTAGLADSRNAPPGPPPGEDYADSYGYADGNGAPMPMTPPYGAPMPRHDAPVYQPMPNGAAYSDDWDHHEHRDRMRNPQHPMMGYDYGVVDDTVMYQGHWVGSMTGSWNGGPVRTWQGTFDSTNGQTHWHGQYVDRPVGYAPQPAFRSEGYARQGYSYGYRYAAPAYEEVMVPSQPIVTKTVRTYVTYVDVPVKTHYVYKRVWHAAYHPICTCAAPRPAPRPRYHPHVIQGS